MTSRYSGRIVGLDLARGLAIIGMITAHIAAQSFAEPSGIGDFFIEASRGRSSILFATLAGVSIAILTGRNVPYSGVPMVQARVRIFTRAAMLIVITGILALMNDMIALILAYYAAWFVLALPFTRWRPRNLFIAAGVMAVAGPTAHRFLNTLLSRLSMDGTGDANGFMVEVMHSGTYTGLVFMAFIFAGMGIGRLRIDVRRIQVILLAVGAVVSAAGYLGGYLTTNMILNRPEVPVSPISTSVVDGSGSSSWMPGSGSSSGTSGSNSISWIPGGDSGLGPDWNPGYEWPGLDAFSGAEPHSGTIFEALGSGGLAIAIIGFLLLTGSWLKWVLYPLAAVGSMSLTAYSAHIILLWFKPGWVGTFDAHPWLITVGSLLLFCTLWKLAFARGPLEWLIWKVSMKAATVPGPARWADDEVDGGSKPAVSPGAWAAPSTDLPATDGAGTGPVSPTSPVGIPDARTTPHHQ